MTRQELEHIIRAAADVTNQEELIIIGSQAILGQYPNAPEELLISMEADVYAPKAPEPSDWTGVTVPAPNIAGRRCPARNDIDPSRRLIDFLRGTRCRNRQVCIEYR